MPHSKESESEELCCFCLENFQEEGGSELILKMMSNFALASKIGEDDQNTNTFEELNSESDK